MPRLLSDQMIMLSALRGLFSLVVFLIGLAPRIHMSCNMYELDSRLCCQLVALHLRAVECGAVSYQPSSPYQHELLYVLTTRSNVLLQSSHFHDSIASG